MIKRTDTHRSRIQVTTGFEAEFIIIDKATGEIAHGADDILAKVEEKSRQVAHSIVKESAKNLIEVGSYPDLDGANTMTSLLEGVRLLVYVSDELGYGLLPLGTYPGKYTPSMRKDARYMTQEKLHGVMRFKNSGRCAGYHCHNSLPKGVFDSKTLSLKSLTRSKQQEELVHARNLLIAMDPALTTFMQSSPFYQGLHIAKDSRMIMYRGGEEFGKNVKGLYSNFPKDGALPPYLFSGADIIHDIEVRYADRMQAYRETGVPEKDIPVYKSKLATNWTPVKINAHGTIEQRGMDMNHLPLVFSVSILLWRILYHVRQHGLKVMPHDIGAKEPFKLEHDTILVPPYTHVRNRLQVLSAKEGMQNEEVFAYCKRLVALVKHYDGKKADWLLRPLDAMLESRMTTADFILSQARAFGHTDLTKQLPQDIAARIAKSHSRKVFEDIIILEMMIQENKNLTEGEGV